MEDTNTISHPVQELKHAPIRNLFWRRALRRMLRDRLTLFALFGLLFMTLLCIFGPPILEQVLNIDSTRTSVTERYTPPGPTHPLGTDNVGRDQLLRLLYGGRISLAIASFSALLTMGIGVVSGLAAGYYGGTVDAILRWIISTLDSIPAFFMLIVVTTIWSPGPSTLIVLLAFLGWSSTARLVRGEVLALRERDYVLAAQALGAPNWRVMMSHLLPNLFPLIIVSLSINAGSLILIESGLSFLGLGVQPPTPTWGNMLTEARAHFYRGPYLIVWPGIMIAVTVLFLFLIGDGLRDALDPRRQ
ncbi:MAG: ABC transporter permease [Anaerolineae bacterium]